MIKQDAFATVPSRRAVFSEGRGPRAAVRALGSETALQPTSNRNAMALKGGCLHPIARDNGRLYIGFVFAVGILQSLHTLLL
jgi:hypothetical protein